MVKNNNYFLNVIQHSSIISRVMNNYELFVDALVRSKRKMALPILYILLREGGNTIISGAGDGYMVST